MPHLKVGNRAFFIQFVARKTKGHMNLNKNKDKIAKMLAHVSKKLKKHQTFIFSFLIIVVAFDYFLFPLPALAQAEGDLNASATAEELIIEQKESVPAANLPVNEASKPKKIKIVQITAYNSEAGQTDSDPCTTANGFNVCKHGVEDTIATNALPFGAKVRIPELFGDKIFTVRDRMNRRYTDRVDVWMLSHEKAVNFGVKVAKLEILP
ncbi:MAG: hypothetical protein WCW77_01270 [Patescibacteria group bacterium]